MANRPTREHRGLVVMLAGHLFPAVLASQVTLAASNVTSAPGGNPEALLWGDTHLHTMLSADANILGNLAFTPELAYRFAKGQAVTTSTGQQAQLDRPLDFLVVADHAEYFGVVPALRAEKLGVHPVGARGRDWISRFLTAQGDARPEALELVRTFSSGKPLMTSESKRIDTWQSTVAASDAANEPGTFTALSGFEWTAQPAGNNLHRVVILRDGRDKTEQLTPLSLFDSFDPEHLWDFLADYEQRTGGQALAIPHNGNLSNGLMFTDTQYDGRAMDATYAAKRARWEPLVEVTQIKGDSEAHPSLSPGDAYADFGTWDSGNLDSTSKKLPWMLRYEYARAALKTGLELQHQLGVNPYTFGMIGSTDSHSGLATADDDNFWGKGPPWEPGQAARVNSYFIAYGDEYAGNIMGWDQLASGYVAVWARENTRGAIFEALKRREVYATTGPRIRLRYFAGSGFSPEDLQRGDWIDSAYRKGVPMGGQLGKLEDSLSLLIVAERDPQGANLDRVQVVKGWVDESGDSHEQVYNVAWSGDRGLSDDGVLPPLSVSLDLDSPSYDTRVGSSRLAVAWTDPDFDPNQPAFYYLRVLEVPTPRWVAYDRARLGVDMPDSVPLVHQERAYSSPIWYKP